jgi:predicted component of type VI protein secretion system
MSLLNKFRLLIGKKDLKEEIIEHICDLLNTRKGFGTYRDDLGLDAYIYMGSNNSVSKKIIQDIKQCLEKFENRIQIEDIQSVSNDSPFFLSFLIKCKIQNVSHSFQIAFHHQNKSFDKEIAL